MPRSKPFSGKQKREQLKEKRAKRVGDDNSDSEDIISAGAGTAEVPIAAGGSHIPSELLTSSLGKSGKRNRFSTVFARESNDEVQRRRNESAEVLDTSLRGAPWVAHPPLNSDPVLQHPSGTLLKHSAHIRDKLIYLKESARLEEEKQYQTWLENIYRRYTREQLNYFEHSIEVWQQLWHTLASSDVICIVADVRNPLWHVPHSYYFQVVDELKKPLIIILNKTDLVDAKYVDAWVSYLRSAFPKAAAFIPFTSSGLDLGGVSSLAQRRKAITVGRKAKDAVLAKRRQACVHALLSSAGCSTEILAAVRDMLVAMEAAKTAEPEPACDDSGLSAKAVRRRLRKEKKAKKLAAVAEEVEEDVEDDGDEELSSTDEVSSAPVETPTSAPIGDSAVPLLTVGMVGHPNAGKSSVINTICGGKRVSVSRTAGHTKRAQTVPVVPGLHLLDCPGLVFPHALVPEPVTEGASTRAPADMRLFEQERAMQELLGVIPIAQVREPYTAIRYVAERIPLESMYGLHLPKDEEEWSPLLICEALATKKGLHIAKSGRPDAHAAGRQILYDSQDGIIPIAWLPPPVPS